MATQNIEPPDFLPIQEDIFSRATEGTCDWIVEDLRFQQWVYGDSAQRTLWLYGLPGCGKTVATSIIVNYLLNIRPNDSSTAYIYCNHDMYSKEKRPDLIRNIVKQLTPGSRFVSLDDCMEYLTKAFRRRSRTFIIIDALDECLDADFLIRILRKLHDMGGNTRFLITSRNLEGYHGRLGDETGIHVRATASDINKYIQQSIKENIKLERAIARDPTLESEITDYVVQNAEGMFLLPRLWLDQLSKQHSPRQIRRILRSSEFKLPMELSRLYNEAMQRIQRQEPEDIHLAHDALTWIIRAKEPLTVPALTHALGIVEGDTQFQEDGTPYPESIIPVCAGLVSTHKQSPENVEFRLAHPTLTKFFHRNPQLLSHKLELLPRACLTYLSIALSQVDCPRSEDEYPSWVHNTLVPLELAYPLLRYACQYWPVHARELQNTAESFWKRICEFLWDKPSEVRLCILIAGLVDCIPDTESTKLPPPNISPMHAAVVFDLPTAVTMLYAAVGLESVNATDTNGNTPLSWAAYSDRAMVLEALLSTNPDQDLNHVGLKGKGAIFYAVEKGSFKALEIFSRNFAAIDTGKHDSEGETPAIIAAKNGHLRCINVLVEDFKVKIDLADTIGATPLVHATRAGHIDVIRALLGTHGADATCATTDGETALSEAIFGDHKEAAAIIVEHLILRDQGAHIESIIHKAIFETAKNGNIRAFQNILQLCKHLDTMADARNTQRLSIPRISWGFHQITDEAGRTPLSHAAEAGHVDMTQELLKLHVYYNVMTRDKKHWTPLHYAIFNGNIEVLRLLLGDNSRGYLHFTGPDDSSDSDYYDDEENSWIREESNKIFKDLSTLVASPAFIRPGKSPAISQTPTGIIPCAQFLLEKLHPSTRLNLMLKRILHHAVLQTIILHPEHKHRLDTQPQWGNPSAEYLKKCPMIKSVSQEGGDGSTELAVQVVGRKGWQVKVLLKCGPDDTVDSDDESIARRRRRLYEESSYY